LYDNDRYIFNSKELEELHDDTAVRANQEVALELIKSHLKRKATCLWELVGVYYYPFQQISRSWFIHLIVFCSSHMRRKLIKQWFGLSELLMIFPLFILSIHYPADCFK